MPVAPPLLTAFNLKLLLPGCERRTDPGAAILHPDYLDSVEKITWYNDTTFWATATRMPLVRPWFKWWTSRTVEMTRRCVGAVCVIVCGWEGD